MVKCPPPGLRSRFLVPLFPWPGEPVEEVGEAKEVKRLFVVPAAQHRRDVAHTASAGARAGGFVSVPVVLAHDVGFIAPFERLDWR